MAFIGVSSFLFVYGITRHSWHLLPLLASEAFRQSVMAAQWTLLLTAALYLPWLAGLVAVKPQTGLAVLAPTSGMGLKAAAIGSLALLLVSVTLIPSWPADWLTLVQAPTDHMRPRVLSPGDSLSF
ncbi:hypothetical protein BH23GEM2_BH23GEM2_24270 [soil metagenome]